MKVCPACNATYDDNMVFCPKDGGKLLDSGSSEENSRVGQVIDKRYRLVKLLGEGGMGEVYEAVHLYIDKKVAIKLLRPEITSSSEAVKRFHQEAKSASSIGQENIIEIIDFGKLDDGTTYLAMEYLNGEALADIMLDGPIDNARALNFMIQICEGLSAAHAKNIVHRDMKPENVIIIRDKHNKEVVKILDFGIAKMTQADEEEGHGLTKTGTIFGTPHYMSPEQAMGKKLDHRADIYSIGVMMFELFTGSVPFKAESFMGILTQHITNDRPKPTSIRQDIPPEIEACILKAMAKEPDDRYQTMDEFLIDLINIGKTLGIETPPPPPPRNLVPVSPSLPTYHPQTTGAPMPAAQGTYPPQGTGVAMPAAQGTYPPQGTGVAMPAAQGTYPPQGTVPPATSFPQTQSPIAGQSTTMQQNKKGNGILFLILFILIAGGGGGGGYWYFMIYSKDKDENKTEVASNDKDKDSPENNDDKKDNNTSENDSMKPDAMHADTMDVMKPIAMNEDVMDSMKPEVMKVETKKIMVFTTIDSLNPPPKIKIDDKDYDSPYTIDVPVDDQVAVQITREGYKTVTKIIKSSGASRIKIKMSRLRKHISHSMKPTMRPRHMRPRHMKPRHMKPASWLD